VIVLPYLGHVPRIGSNAEAPPSAAVIGRAELGPGCRLGHLSVVRADGEHVQIGANSWFGEASTVHIADELYPALVGSRVTVGRYGLVHACRVGDGCVIGEHAAVMDGAVLGEGTVIAAESVVPPGKRLEGGWVYAGAPARPVERITAAETARWHEAVRGGADPGVPHVFAARPLVPLRHAVGTGVRRNLPHGAYVADTASIWGQVVLGPCASVWFGVEIDAGAATVVIGAATNVQDNSRLYGGGPGEDIRIGPRVLIGHNVRIFPSVIEEGAIIGMGATIGRGTVVRAGGCVAAGSATEPGTEVHSGQVFSGRPARAARPLSERNREDFARAIDVYVRYSANYLATTARAGHSF